MTSLLFSRPHILENQRVKLYPLEEKHELFLWEIAAEPAIWQFTNAKIKDRADFEEYVSAAISERQQQLSFPFAVYDKKNDCWAGSTRFGSLAFDHKRVEIGWTWYRKSLQGTGLNMACKLLLLDFAFRDLGLNRVELKTSLLNIRSQKAMEKLGAVKEGILRRHMINPDGSPRDSVFYSFISEEWEQTRADKFKPLLGG